MANDTDWSGAYGLTMCARPSAAYLKAQRQAKKARVLDDRLKAISGTLVASPGPDRRKFRNTPTVYKGVRYDSLGEAEYAAKLDARCLAGELIDWERPKALILIDSPNIRSRISYRPDFYVIPKVGHGYYVDYKGGHITETPVWKMKLKLWRLNIPHELRVAYATGEEKIVATGLEYIKPVYTGLYQGSDQ